MSDSTRVDETGRTSTDSELREDWTIPNENVEITIQELEKKIAVNENVENEDVAYALYCKYARVKGFTVRKGRNIKFYDGSGLQANEFVCSREGLKDEKCSNDRIPEYQKTDSRCNCQAMFKVGRTKGGPWMVKKFLKEHNHDMFAPDQTYLLRTSRNVTIEQELIMTTMLNSKISISRAINVLEDVAGGRDKVGFIPRDAYDCMARVKQKTKKGNRKTKMENSDSFELMQHFKNKAKSDPDFFWDYELDDDDRLMNFYCRDSRCLIDYGHFSDVVSIDTTYRTNIYDMICAPFVGINHHHENILFGFAILSDETEETFTWLFGKFLESMGEKQPGVVFTDQCRAMMNAVEVIFNEAHHKLCQWHINQNAPSHFGNLNYDLNFKSLWKKCMSYCESEEEFEAIWKEMENKYKVGEQTWFQTMYKLRKKWSTAFSNTKFSAGLNTTSRSEGTNSALKKYIKNKTSTLLECVIAYEKVQDDWRLKEKENDTLCYHNKPSLFVPHPLLKHAAGLYTFNMFKFFEKEFKDTMALEIPEKIASVDSSITVYKVKTHDRPWFRTVEYDSEKTEIICSCHRNTTVGILCRHSMKVFDVVNMRSIPDKYIIKRWCKRAKSELYVSQSSNESPLNNTAGGTYIYEMAFVSHATKELRELAMQGKRHVDTRNIVMKHIANAKNEMLAWFKENDISDLTEVGDLDSNKGNNMNEDIIVRDPLVAKPRGVRNDHKRHWDEKSKKGKGRGKEKQDNASDKRPSPTSKAVAGGGKKTQASKKSRVVTKVQNSQPILRPSINQPVTNQPLRDGRIPNQAGVSPLQYPFLFASPSPSLYVRPLRDEATGVQSWQHPFTFANPSSSLYARPDVLVNPSSSLYARPDVLANHSSSSYVRPDVLANPSSSTYVHPFSFETSDQMARNHSEYVSMLGNTYPTREFHMSQQKK